jgi:hypothetical protein
MKAWCPAGHRPLVAKQGVREYVYAYAAIAPKLGKMTRLGNFTKKREAKKSKVKNEI